MVEISGKVIIVTGAARGIGLEYAQAFAAAGASVVAADINDCSGAVGGEGADRILPAHLDVASMESAQKLADFAVEQFGRIDALVNNAALYGSLKGGRFDALAERDWDACMTVNVKGVWNCCKAVVPAMRKVGGGSIVNIASLAATFGAPLSLHYTTSKAAVIGLTRGLARELGRDNIRVNAVAPSAVVTEGTQEFFGDKAEKALEVMKMRQTIQANLLPSDLTGTVAWLISDSSRLVTGQTISVDGGTVMH